MKVFDVPWIGVMPVATSGEDVTVGSTRTMPLEEMLFIEEVLEAHKSPNGSFSLVVGQKDGK